MGNDPSGPVAKLFGYVDTEEERINRSTTKATPSGGARQRDRGGTRATMSRLTLRQDRTAVSPVVGAVLLIAIVLVLVAAVGTFATQTNDQVNEPVDAEVQFSLDGDTLSVEYISVEPVRADRVDVVGDEASGSTLVTTDADAALGANAEVEAGDEWVAATNVEPGDVFRVVYDVPGDDRTVVVGTFEA